MLLKILLKMTEVPIVCYPFLECLNKKKMQVQELYPNKLHFNGGTNHIST